MTDRAVSTALSYVLILGILTLLLSGLTMGLAPLVTNQQAEATHTTLTVLGNDVAGDIASSDQLAVAAGADGSVLLRTRLPDRVGGSSYEITVEDVAGEHQLYELTVESADPETSATVRVRTRTAIDVGATGTLDGGDLEIVFDGERLVIENV